MCVCVCVSKLLHSKQVDKTPSSRSSARRSRGNKKSCFTRDFQRSECTATVSSCSAVKPIPLRGRTLSEAFCGELFVFGWLASLSHDSFPIKTLLLGEIRGGESQFPARHFSRTTRRSGFRLCLCVLPISSRKGRGESQA